MPAALLHLLLPMIIGMAGSHYGPKILGSQAERMTKAGRPGLGGVLGKLAGKPGGFSPVGMAAWLLPMLPMMLMQHGEANEGESVAMSEDNAQFSEMLRMMSRPRPAPENDVNFLRLLQQQELQGNLAPALQQLGINVEELI